MLTDKRSLLPYRKNCEGYFLCSDGKIIALDTGKGYLEFPGGGVDENEEPKNALIREALEEAGIILRDDLNEIGVLNFLWEHDWAKTDKQRMRYLKFKGEEMHFFVGKVKDIVNPTGDIASGESGWKGEVKMEIKKAIEIIESGKPFGKDIKKYRNVQLKILNDLLKGKIKI